MSNLDAAVQNNIKENTSLPKSWYVIIGGLFKGVRFGNYDREMRQDVNRYAIALLTARKQRVRDARKQQQTTTLTPEPVSKPEPVSALAKPTAAVAQAPPGLHPIQSLSLKRLRKKHRSPCLQLSARHRCEQSDGRMGSTGAGDDRNSLRSELMHRLMHCTALQLEQNYDSRFRRSERGA
eukprot:3941107-Pleurochrysis_carterae.AAC.4